MQQTKKIINPIFQTNGDKTGKDIKKDNEKTNPIAYLITQGNMSALDHDKPPDFEIIDLTGGSNHHAH